MGRWSSLPLARIGFVAAVGGPAFAIGGVLPEVVLVFVVVVLLLWLRLGLRQRGRLRWPYGATVGFVLVAVTLLQWLPISSWWVHTLAPPIADAVDSMRAGMTFSPWTRLSTVPGNTGLEVARLAGLTALFIAGAQVSWRFLAAIVVACAVGMASVGFVHELTGAHAIYGLYWPKERSLAASVELVTAFVNPNHQSALFLLGVFSAWALAVYERARGRTELTAAEFSTARDRVWALPAAIVLLVFALLLSLSRGALVVLVCVAAVAWLDLGRQVVPESFGARFPPSTRSRRLGLGALAVFGIVVVGSHGAWQQLVTLTQPGAVAEKFGVVTESLRLVAWAPVLGIGRGSFVDVYPLLGSTGTDHMFTHIENLPMAFVVEWGPWVGGLVLVTSAFWFRGSWQVARDRSERLALLGLAAVALQNLADFNLEYLGVAAPVVALAGALSPTARTRRGLHRDWRVGLVMLIVGTGVAAVSVESSWSATQDAKRAHWRDAHADQLEQALTVRPLDGDLYLALARRAAQQSTWSRVETLTAAVRRTRTNAVEASLLTAAALEYRGEMDDAADAYRRALADMRPPVSMDLARYLVARTPDPARLALWIEAPGAAVTSLVARLLQVSPAHADAVARRWEQLDPNDPKALAYRTRAAVALEQPALALHLARLYAAKRPRDGGAYLLWATALRKFTPARERDAAVVLRAGLAEAHTELGAVEEQLLASHLHRADWSTPDAVRSLTASLLARDASIAVRRRRADLVRRVLAQLDATQK